MTYFSPKLLTCGMDFMNCLTLGCHSNADERGCSRRNAPPIAWTVQSSKQVLQGRESFLERNKELSYRPFLFDLENQSRFNWVHYKLQGPD